MNLIWRRDDERWSHREKHFRSGSIDGDRSGQMTRRVRLGSHSMVDWRWWSRKVDLIKLLDVIDCPRMGDPEDLSLSVNVVQFERFHSTKCGTESSADKRNSMSNNRSIHLCWMKESRMIDDEIRLFRKNLRFIRCSSPLLHHEFQSIRFVIRSWTSKIVVNDHSNRRRWDGVTMKWVDDRRRTFLQWLEDQMQKKRILRSTRTIPLEHRRHRNVSPCPSPRSTRWKWRKTDGSSITIDEQFNWETREISSETERFLSKIFVLMNLKREKKSSFRYCSSDRSIIDCRRGWERYSIIDIFEMFTMNERWSWPQWTIGGAARLMQIMNNVMSFSSADVLTGWKGGGGGGKSVDHRMFIKTVDDDQHVDISSGIPQQLQLFVVFPIVDQCLLSHSTQTMGKSFGSHRSIRWFRVPFRFIERMGRGSAPRKVIFFSHFCSRNITRPIGQTDLIRIFPSQCQAMEGFNGTD